MILQSPPRLSLLMHRSLPAAGLAALLPLGAALEAADLSVPNGSFEEPATTFVDTRIDLWSKTPQPEWFDPATTGGITWDQLTGVFANTAPDQPNHIDNLDGNQALFLFSLPQVGISQVLTHPEARFEPGFSYTLTVGLLGGGGLPQGDTLQLGLFYLDGANNPVSVGATTVTYTAAEFPTITHLIDRSAQTTVIQAGDAAAGQPIGISLVSTGTGVGYWDLDHVRLSATAVPEPKSVLLFGLGLTALGWVVRRSRPQG